MSSPITPPQRPVVAQPVRPIAAARSSAAAQSARAPFTLEPTVSLDTVPSSPPQEVLEQMASAARTYER